MCYTKSSNFLPLHISNQFVMVRALRQVGRLVKTISWIKVEYILTATYESTTSMVSDHKKTL